MAHTIDEIRKLRNGRGTSAASSSDSTKTRSTGHSVDEIRRLGGRNVYEDSEGYKPTKRAESNVSAPARATSDAYRYGTPSGNATLDQLNTMMSNFNKIQAVLSTPKNMPDFKSDSEIKDYYESIPDYNVFERIGDSEKTEKYNQKQALSSKYNEIKKANDLATLNAYGITEDELKKAQTYLQGANGGIFNKKYMNERTSKEEMQKIYDKFDRVKEETGINPYELQFDYQTEIDEELANEHPISSTISTYAANPVESTLNTGKKVINYATGKPIENDYSYTNNIRNTITNNIDTEAGRFAYGTVNSIADMAVAAGLSHLTGSRMLGPGLQGFEKADAVMNESVNRGLNPTQVMMEGIASGITTAATESIPMGKWEEIAEKKLIGLGKEAIKKNVVKKLLAGMASEGLQEMSEDVADLLVDRLIAGDKSEIDTNIRTLMEINPGMTKEEAEAQAWKDWCVQVVLDGVGGAISGGVMSGLSIGVGLANPYATGYINREALSEQIKKMDSESEVYKTYQDLAQKRGENLSSASDDEVSDLFQKAYAEASRADRTAYDKVISDKLKEAGYTDEQVKATLEALTAKNPTKRQKFLIDNELVRDAVNEADNTEGLKMVQKVAENVEAIDKTIKSAQEVKEEKRIAEAESKINTDTESSVKGDKVEIYGMDIKGGVYVVNTSKGSFPVEDVKIASDIQDAVTHSVNISDDNLKEAFVKNYHGQDISAYEAYAYRAFTAGKSFNQNLIDENTIDFLGSKAVHEFLDAGRLSVRKQTKESEERAIQAASEAKGKFKQGTFTNNVDYSKLDSTRKKIFNFLKGMSNIGGLHINVINDINGQNGMFQYDPNGGTITVNLAAGATDANGNNTQMASYIIPTLSHEMTHYLEANAPSAYNALEKAVLKALRAEGFDIDAEVSKKIDAYKKATNGKVVLTESEALDEIIAQSCEGMMSNEETMEKTLSFMNMKEVKTFKKALEKFFNAIKSFVKSLVGSDAQMNRYALAINKNIDDIQDVWAKALALALERQQILNGESDKDVGIQIDTNTDTVAHSIRTTLLESLNPVGEETRQRYSIREDSAYMEAVENGNLTLAQQMVDQAANKAGYTIKGYHGTDSFGFTKFSKSDDGFSFFFAQDEDTARSYVFNNTLVNPTIEVKSIGKNANVPSPKRGVKYSEDELRNLAERYKKAFRATLYGEIKVNAEKQYATIGGERVSGYGMASYLDLRNKKGIYDTWIKMNNPLVIEGNGANWNNIKLGSLGGKFNQWWRSLHDSLTEEDYFTSASTRSIVKYAKDNGHDGVIFKDIIDNGGKNAGQKGSVSTIYAVFDSSQIKSADPVTYDDNGNIIPLSERFDSSQKDIRYSLREDSEGNKLTEEQAEFFKDSKAVDENGNLLVMYHGTVSGGFTVFNSRESYSSRTTPYNWFSDNIEVAERFKNGTKMHPLNVPKIYKGYVLTTNPFIYDAKGASWNMIPAYGEILNSKEGTYRGIRGEIKNKDTLDTETIAKYAKNHGYDSAIINNVGEVSSETPSLAKTVIATFESKQFKNIDNLNPTSNPDIRYSLREDSDGNILTDGQIKRFEESKARDDEGHLLVLYHGTPTAGFNIFKPGTYGIMMTTSMKDALSYGGADTLYDPNEKQIDVKVKSGNFMIGDHLRFDTEEEKKEFLKKNPNAESYMTKRELYERENEIEDSYGKITDEEYDKAMEDLRNKEEISKEISKEYYKYQYSRSKVISLQEMIDNADLYTLDDFKNALMQMDQEAAFDDEYEYESDSDFKDALLQSLDYMKEEYPDESDFDNIWVRVRIPEGEEAISPNVNRIYNRAYKMYADAQHPYIVDMHGQKAERAGAYYDALARYMESDEYDSIIVKNMRVGRYKELGTVVAVKSSEQVSLTSNQNPTKNPDIRYSLREDRYEAKENYVNKIMSKNAKIESLSDKEHSALREIASIRHLLHTNKEKMFSSDSNYWNDYEKINEILSEAGLDEINLIDVADFPTENDYYDFLDDEEKNEWEEKAKQFNNDNPNSVFEHDGFSMWKEESGEYSNFLNMMENVNTEIEKYLSEIDRIHGTQYAPSGASRLYSIRETDPNLVTEDRKEKLKTLKEDIALLKERANLDKQESKGQFWKPETLDAVAKYVIDETKTTVARKELREDLSALYNTIAYSVAQEDGAAPNSSEAYERIMNNCYKLATKIYEASPMKVKVDANVDPSAKQTIGKIKEQDAIQDLAVKIYNKYWSVKRLETVADKYQKKVDALEKEHKKNMTVMLKKQGLADEIFYKDIINKVKKQAAEEKANYKEKNKQKAEAQKEANERRAEIEKITDQAKTLSKWLFQNSKNHPVPDPLKTPLLKMLAAIDPSSKQLLGLNNNSEKAFTPTKKDESMSLILGEVAEALKNINQEVSDSEKQDGNKESGLGFLDVPQYMIAKLDKIAKDMHRLEYKYDTLGKKILELMDLESLQELRNDISMIKTAISTVNYAISQGNKIRVNYVAQYIIQYLKDLGQAKRDSLGNLARPIDFLTLDNTTPYYFFKHLGKGGEIVFNILADGMDEMTDRVEKISNFTESLYTEEEQKKWRNNIREFELTQKLTETEKAEGKPNKVKVKLTDAQIMSLYCLAKRDINGEFQGLDHMLRDGIVIGQIDGKKKIGRQDTVTITQSQLDNIISIVEKDKRMKEVADGLVKFMSTTLADWGNEVTWARWGIKQFVEDHYFPIAVNKETTKSDNIEKSSSLFALLNQDFTKPLQKEVRNEIMVYDIFDVFTKHASDMARYSSLGLPILDTIKVWNYSEAEMKGDAAEEKKKRQEAEESGERYDRQRKVDSVKKSIAKAFGEKGGNRYISNLLKNLNGQADKGVYDNIGMGMMKRYKASKIAASTMTALVQPLSYLRAGYVMNPKYMLEALTKAPQVGKMFNNVQVAKWKRMSLGVDTNIGRGVDRIINHQNTFGDKIVDKSLWLAEKMDELTWGYLYNACEAEIKATRKDLKPETKEFDQAVADRAREVIYSTQIFDSTLTRSSFMRDKGYHAQMLSAFMSEPTLSYNMLLDSVTQYIQDAKRNGSAHAFKNKGKVVVRSISVYTLSAVVESVIREAFTRFRDYQDDDEEFFEDFWKDVIDRLKDELNILNKLPYAKQLMDAIEAFGKAYQNNNKMDEAFIQDIGKSIKAIDKAMESQEISYNTVYTVLNALADVTGLPFGNALREVKMIWNNTIGRVTGKYIQK